jgi:N-acetylglucosaminyldiphosphoundecaprenol N-acetyl-beta-D-mannosaminyltransferase
MQKKLILQSEITNASYSDILQRIVELAKLHVSAYVCLANVHMVIEAFKDRHFGQILNNAAIAAPDGKPVSILMNLLYGTRQERVAGPDLMLDILHLAAEKGVSVFFYGSTEEVINALRQKLAVEYPRLQIAGMLSPPFQPMTEQEDDLHTEMIRQSGAGLVLVGLGCPKQERWMAAHQGKIDGVMLGVGAAFPFYTGHVRRCPKWMQNASLEWLYRLLSEPKRLFKRYFQTNTLFLLLAFRELWRLKVLRKGCRQLET